MEPDRLLLIDDEPEIGSFIRTVAEDCGYQVAATSAAQAFKSAYASFRPTVIALDLAIPGTDGIELLKFLAEQDCPARILLLSGLGRGVLETAERLDEARGLDMVGIISKPGPIAELRSLLSNLHSVA
jgi:DNA-binding response OmpR family regulator